MGDTLPTPDETPATEPVTSASSGTIVANPKRPYKAIAAFVLTFLGTLWANLSGHDSLGNMSAMEWLSIIVPTLVATGAVYGIANPITYKEDRS